MKLLSEAKLRQLQAEFPAGTRIELVSMDDPQAPPVGTKGTVRLVDAIGSLVVDWDNGCGLNVVYGEDVVKKLDSVTVITYGQKQIWDSRAEAIAFYLEGMANCEGAERDRYTNIYLALISGEKVCKDEPDDE